MAKTHWRTHPAYHPAYILSEEDIQEQAKELLGRKLTDGELIEVSVAMEDALEQYVSVHLESCILDTIPISSYTKDPDVPPVTQEELEQEAEGVRKLEEQREKDRATTLENKETTETKIIDLAKARQDFLASQAKTKEKYPIPEEEEEEERPEPMEASEITD